MRFFSASVLLGRNQTTWSEQAKNLAQ
jgi:hypothetical protein